MAVVKGSPEAGAQMLRGWPGPGEPGSVTLGARLHSPARGASTRWTEAQSLAGSARQATTKASRASAASQAASPPMPRPSSAMPETTGPSAAPTV